MLELIINGKSSKDFGLCLTETPVIPSPERDTELRSIRGRNGSLIRKYGFKDLEFTCELNFISENVKSDIRAIKKWVYDAHTVVFSNDDEFYYKILDAFTDDVVNDLNIYGKFTVNFIAKPFQYRDRGKSSGSEIKVFNEGTVEMEAVLDVINTVPSTETTYTINVFYDKDTNPYYTALVGPLNTSTPSVTVDSMNMETYLMGDRATQKNPLLNGSYLRLRTGMNTIKITGANGTMTLYKTEAFL